jgi:hypothetical protein
MTHMKRAYEGFCNTAWDGKVLLDTEFLRTRHRPNLVWEAAEVIEVLAGSAHRPVNSAWHTPCTFSMSCPHTPPAPSQSSGSHRLLRSAIQYSREALDGRTRRAAHRQIEATSSRHETGPVIWTATAGAAFRCSGRAFVCQKGAPTKGREAAATARLASELNASRGISSEIISRH